MKAVRAISAILLATLVVVSSTSFRVGLHLCMGQVQHVALFAKAPACEKEREVPPCHRQADPCCEDEAVIYKGDDFHSAPLDISIYAAPLAQVELPHVLLSEIIPEITVLRTKYFNYDPPLPVSDLTVEHGVFLI